MRGWILWMSVVALSAHLRNPSEPTVTIANGKLHAVLADAFAVDLDLESEPVTIEFDPGQPPSIHVDGVNMVFGEQRGHGRGRASVRKRAGEGLAAGDDSRHQAHFASAVFTWHGPAVPRYYRDSLAQIRYTNPSLPIYVLTNDHDFVFPSVTVVNTEKWDDMAEMQDFAGRMKAAIGCGPGSCTTTVNGRLNGWAGRARYYYLAKFMKERQLQDVLYVEGDNLVFGDVQALVNQLRARKVKLAMTPLTAGMFTASLLYAQTPADMRFFIHNLDMWDEMTPQQRQGVASSLLDSSVAYVPSSDEADSDMQFLGWFAERNKGVVHALPTLPFQPASQNRFDWLKSGRQQTSFLDIEGKPYIFDPGSYGQWRGGLHALWHHTVQAAILRKSMVYDEHRSAVAYQRKTYPLFNLHCYDTNYVAIWKTVPDSFSPSLVRQSD